MICCSNITCLYYLFKRFEKTIMYVVIACFFISCTSNKDNMSGDLPVIDVTKEYKEISLDVHEIADVEYIPLETTDSSVMWSAFQYVVSDDYVIADDTQYIFFFDRKTGKFIRKFGYIGDGPEEYTRNYKFAIDLKTQECFIYDMMKNNLQVYDFHGKFLRKHSIQKPIAEFACWYLYNYDDDHLILYSQFPVADMNYKDKHPFYFLHKRTGEISAIPLEIEHRLTNVIKRGTPLGPIIYAGVYSLLHDEEEFLFADFGQDTLYSFKDRNLKPIAVRTPALKEMDLPIVVAPLSFTEDYMFFYIVRHEYVPSDPWEPLNEAPHMLWNRKTGEINRIKLYNSDIRAEKDIEITGGKQHLPPNCGVSRLRPDFLIEQHEKGNLRNELDSIASHMSEDDNSLLVLYHFKQKEEK